MNRPLYYPTILLMFFALLTSCEKFLEIDEPIDTVSTQGVFADSAGATAAVTGIYQTLGTNPSVDIYLLQLTGIGGDELQYNSTQAAYLEYMQNNIQPNNFYGNALWQNCYRAIYQANLIIEKLSEGQHPYQSDRFIGEAKLARALMYHYLVNLFGDVPLILTTDYQTNERLPRTPQTEVYRQIEADLLSAIDLLPSSYIGNHRTRPNRFAACALLARFYLCREEWEKAIAFSSEVIGAEYRLADPETAFLKESPETVWQLFPTLRSYEVPEAAGFIPSSLATASPNFSLSPTLFALFEEGDLRKRFWIGEKVVNEDVFHYPFKYKVRFASGGTPSEYPIMFRLAEQYLIRAEAHAHLGSLEQAVADLDSIRLRADQKSIQTALPVLDQVALLDAIATERRKELFADRGGHRWFDLKRTGKIDEVLQQNKPGFWEHHDAWWPIPSAQIGLNNSLIQNEGYTD